MAVPPAEYEALQPLAVAKMLAKIAEMQETNLIILGKQVPTLSVGGELSSSTLFPVWYRKCLATMAT